MKLGALWKKQPPLVKAFLAVGIPAMLYLAYKHRQGGGSGGTTLQGAPEPVSPSDLLSSGPYDYGGGSPSTNGGGAGNGIGGGDGGGLIPQQQPVYAAGVHQIGSGACPPGTVGSQIPGTQTFRCIAQPVGARGFTAPIGTSHCPPGTTGSRNPNGTYTCVKL